MFYMCESHIYDSLDGSPTQPPTLQLSVAMLDAVTSTPVDVCLNLDGKG